MFFYIIYLRYRVKQGGLESRNDSGQIRSQILLVCEGIHVANDLGCHFTCFSGAIHKRPLNDRHDERKRGRVYEVHKLCVQQSLQACGGLVTGVLQGFQEHRYNGLNKTDYLLSKHLQEILQWLQLCLNAKILIRLTLHAIFGYSQNNINKQQKQY